ncbi:hypothetical protein LG296_01555 [Ureibacillus chungkukjangi]|uniref:hypothetical protein n=1 Tax=Ureibacillus chungkukjangi TaxID=1202712 RepID=UPI0038502908
MARWKAEELEYLESNYGTREVSKIAKYLNRTEIAVVAKARRLGLSMLTAGGYLTLSELAKHLHVDIKTIKLWHTKGLKYRELTVYKQKYIFIDISNFWKWAKDNQNLINFSKIERGMLAPEPEWLDRAYKNYVLNTPKRKGIKWTALEDKHLLAGTKRGDSLEVISNELGRSIKSLQTRMARIMKTRAYIKWTQKEIDLLIRMDQQGIRDKEIAEQLGREVVDIKSKRKSLRSKGIYKYDKRKKHASA